MNKKMLSINLISTFVVFIVNTGISFVLSPYIIENLGSESYAFVKLANDFVTYILLFSIAINSMSSRFISVSYLKGNIKEANSYYTSVFYANLILSGIILIFGIGCFFYIEKLIEIPQHLIYDVKLLFAISILNLILTMCFTVYGVGVFIKNKLYLNNIRGIETSVIRVIFLVLAFSFFVPHIYYIPIATIIVTVYTGFYGMHYTKKLTPELTIDKGDFQIKKIKDVLFSGIWNVVNQLSYILNEGFDLLLSNIFIGATPMGILAIAKTLPNMISSVYANVSSVFMPDLTKQYAKGEYAEIKKSINLSIKILCVIINIPVAGIIVFGKEFYQLWVPSQDVRLIHILSVLTVIRIAFSGSIATVYDIFTVTNKVKKNSIVTLCVGFLNVAIVLFLIKTTNLGIYAIAGISSLTDMLRNYAFTLPYAAKCINDKWTTFYPSALKGVFCCVIVCLVNLVVKAIIPIDGWSSFFISAIIGSSIGLLFNLYIVLNYDERKNLFKKISYVIKSKK